MKKLAIILTAAAITGLAVYTIHRRMKHRAMRDKIAHEGYETAHDILYPRQDNYSRKLQYGPVLPG